MFQASQLSEISGRFSAHVEDIREFLLKQGLSVPSPDAIPELSRRLRTDESFRADAGSLLRTVLYREREGIGYEELLGILVAAAAGTEHDLTSDSQEADIREMLRFVLQSRRSAHHPEAEEISADVEAREAVPVSAEPVPVPVSAVPAGAARSIARGASLSEGSVAVAEADGREWADPVLPFRTGGSFAAQRDWSAAEPELFAAQTELDRSWWRDHAIAVVGIVGVLVGLGAGLMIHRGLPAALTHLAAAPAAQSSPGAPKTVASAPKGSAAASSNLPVSRRHSRTIRQEMNRSADVGAVAEAKPAPSPVAPAGVAETASVAHEDPAAVQPAAPLEGRSTPPPSISEKSSTVPVTVVKQVVRASLSAADSGDASDAPETTAATHSIVRQGSAGIMAANVVYSPPPEYPAAATAARVQGQVTVRAVVDPDGKVIYARVVSGPSLLRNAALEAVQRWRYRPLLYYGKPIAVTTTAILDFKFAK